MSMASRKVVRLGDGDAARVVVVRELTLGDFRTWLKHAAENPMTDAVTALLFEDFDPADLRFFTDLSADDLEQMTPAEMRAVWREVQEVNSDFFGMLGRAAGKAIRSSDSGQSSSAQG